VLCREDCRLTDLFSEVLEEVEALAGRRRLSQRVEPQTLAVSADRGLMRRLLLNLVGNAMKFTPDAEGRIQLQASEVEGRVRIEVCDNGPGVPSEHREKIFDKFWQAEIGRRHERHSTGLGLTFCKLVAEEHGGTIQVAESPDCGCVIRLELSPPPDSERIQPSA
jgi:signal transduction histidine kinase